MTAYARPRDLAEALATRAAHPDYLVIAGGTDVMVHADRRPTPVGLLDLWRLPAIGFVRVTDKELAIGAGTTWHEIAHHPAIRARLAPLAAAAREIGALQIQARGTLGGNVGTSSPVGDSLPVLLALDAELEVASVRGHRRVPYATWCTGYRTTQLAPDELIVAAHVPVPGPTTRATWRKVGTRRAQSISKVMGAAAIALDGDVVTSARIALGAVADRPIRVAAAEAAVVGLPLAQAAEAARAAVRAAIRPIDDVRSTAAYRAAVAENLVARFRREGMVLCNLRDAHTITTYDFDQTPDGTLYIAMELLEGKSLHQVFHESAPLAWKRVFKILIEMCSSLAEAHARGIVHRDLKPENIYLESRSGNPDFVKILDFGIAKVMRGDSIDPQSPQLTATGQTLGTLEYMSPEQLMGKQLDGRSDVYALGVLAYEMITGRLPFPDAKGPAGLITAQLKQTPAPPSQASPASGLTRAADRAILRCLEKDKNQRFPDVTQLAAALQEAITGADVEDVVATAVARPQAAAERSEPRRIDPAGPVMPTTLTT